MKRLAPLFALLLVVAACGDDTATTTTAPPATTTTSTTTTPATSSSTTIPATTTSTATTAPTTTLPPTTTTVAGSPFTTLIYGFFPDPLGTPDDGHGSGCVLAGDVLTDGMWFGFVDAVSGGVATFDLGCFFTGAAAVAAAAADGEEAFDFYIRNQNPRTFAVALAAAGTAYWLDATGDLTPQPIPMGTWPVAAPPSYQTCPDTSCGVWLYVNGGVATELVEQYRP